MDYAACLLAFQRGEDTPSGIAGALLFMELLETVRMWRLANTKK